MPEHADLQQRSCSGLGYTWHQYSPPLPPVTPGYAASLVLKRALDLAVVVPALLLLAPALIGLAAAVKLTSRGPILFRQKRTGQHGKLFTVLKFRSMYSEKSDAAGIFQARAGDDRVTPLGRWMRRTSLDELPQLLNVLIGNMSVVGPRPHVPGMLAAGKLYEELVPYYDVRHEAKPGITGWAQANGFRGPTDTAAPAFARVDHDMAYIQNFSVWLDVRIIALTAWRQFISGSGI